MEKQTKNILLYSTVRLKENLWYSALKKLQDYFVKFACASINCFLYKLREHQVLVDSRLCVSLITLPAPDVVVDKSLVFLHRIFTAS